MFYRYGILIILSACICSCSKSRRIIASHRADESIDVIAFGSCNKQDSAQLIWNVISKNNPDLWIWLGDNIYGDSDDTAVLASKYRMQMQNAAYAEFAAQVRIIGTWDDHDYGINDGGRNFPIKNESKNLLLQFLNIKGDAEVRKHDGVYQSYLFGNGKQQVKIILLDTRYFRDTLNYRQAKSTNQDYFSK